MIDPLIHWTLVQFELASVFDKNGKGVSMATPSTAGGGLRTPGHRGGGQRKDRGTIFISNELLDQL